jgi:hypothetical protein
MADFLRDREDIGEVISFRKFTMDNAFSSRKGPNSNQERMKL